MAIDFERPHYIVNQFQNNLQNTQVGLAILDTRGLASRSQIKTFNFITGENTYFEESAPASHWATAERIPVKNMLSKINNCLRMYQDRSIVLVGHGMSGDLAALNALRFDFVNTPFIAKMDTCLLARDLHMGQLKLKNLLEKLDCPCNFRLHNAANDANYTLRALLLLGIKAIGELENREMFKTLEKLWWIAKGGLLSKMQRKYWRRKIAKTLTLEEQEEVREQRR